MIPPLAPLALLLATQVPCSEWSPGFEIPGVDGPVLASVVFDDGTGPALYVGGDFHAAGPVVAEKIARWDGVAWSALGSGIDAGGQVEALAVHDDGSGPALYVGGSFLSAGGVSAQNIARWDGAAWSTAGGGLGSVRALAVAPTTSGPRLFAGAGGLYEWDGVGWTSHLGLKNGFGGPAPPVKVEALEVFEGKLYVGGRFDYASSQQAGSLAIWDGSWSVLEELLSMSAGDERVESLRVFDDGTGAALYMGGWFDSVGNLPVRYLARWDGITWSDVGDIAVIGALDDMAVFDDGSGPALYVAGDVLLAGGLPAAGLAAWDGSAWAAVGAGLGVHFAHHAAVRTLTVFDDGLFAGGEFDLAAGQDVFHVARWDGDWAALGSSEQWLDDRVCALEVFDPGGGARLYAAGDFQVVAGSESRRIVSWDGAAWEPLGGGLHQAQGGGNVRALTTFDDGGGLALYAGGHFNTAGGPVNVFNLARWDGASWQSPGGGVTFGKNQVNALAVFDDGSGAGLYVGGNFKRAGGVPGFAHIARWDGSAWSTLGSGMDGEVQALAVFDDGAGPALYAAGAFASAGGVAAQGFARWDGSAWAPLGGGMSGGYVNVLLSFDDGSGSALYAGGSFAALGGVPAVNVARWDGVAWTAVGTGLDGEVLALAAVQDGPARKPFLHAGGGFTDYIARWDGAAWSPFDSGTSDVVRALAEFDGGAAPWPSLFAGGDFTGAGGQVSARIARWSRDCGCPPASYCTAGTSASGCQALIQAAGTASASAPSGFLLSADGIEGDKTGLFFYGTNGRQANPWGSGSSFVCVVPPRRRAGLLVGTGTPGACDGSISQDLNARWCPTCPKPSHNPGAGALVQAQLWYRDPLNTSNQSSSLSDAIEFAVCP